MQPVGPGWRSARARPRPVGDAPTPVGAPVSVGGRGPDATASAPAPRPQGIATGAEEPMEWTIPLLCFLLFIFVSTTYAVPLATAAATGALLSLPLIRHFRFPVALLLLAAFVAWAGVGYTATDFPAESWPRWLDLAKAWLIMLVAVNAVQTRRQVMVVTVFFLACFAMYPLRGALFNYFIYRSTIRRRVSWNFIYANSNDLAAFALVPIALCMGICVTRERRDWVWWGAAAGLLTLPLMIFLTQSRGAIIALALLIVLALATYRRRLRALGLLAV